jgi:hypothetical protein
MPTVSISPRLHPATGLRRFSPLFYGFMCQRPVLLDTRCNSCSKDSPRRTHPSKDSGPQAFGGPHHLKGFSPPPLEDYIISQARIFSWLTSLFSFRNLLFCFRDFHVRCSRTHPPFSGAYRLCMHHTSMFCVCPPHTPFFLMHFLLAYFFFSSYVHPYVLSIWRTISLSLLPFPLQDHRFPTDLATTCVKNWRN